MKGPKELIDHEDCWKTTMGLVFPTERVVFRGKDLFHELKDMPWMGLLLYGITGRIFGDKQVKLFEGIWVLCTSYPDPRIWNNRVASLAGTSRSTGTLAVSAAIAVSEAKIYGGVPVIKSIEFLFRTQKALDKGTALRDIVEQELQSHRRIPGYARPLARSDERISPLLELANELGCADGPFVKLVFEIERCLLEGRWRMRMNIAALIAALSADQGLTYEEHYQYMVLCFVGGMHPCFIEASKKPEGTFLPLSCSRIHYEGNPVRAWHETEL